MVFCGESIITEISVYVFFYMSEFIIQSTKEYRPEMHSYKPSRLTVSLSIQKVLYEIRQDKGALLNPFIVITRREGTLSIRRPLQGIVFFRPQRKAVHPRRIEGNEGRI